MKRTTWVGLLSTLWLAPLAFGQTPATQPPSAGPGARSPAPSSSQPRPDARYPNPSGQDSKPNQTPPKKATASTAANGTVEQRGSRTKDQSAASQETAKRKTYQGHTGKKIDPGTACSTARPTKKGGVDCGTSGAGATPGKVPK
jgi:hypothetical protein